MFVAAAAMTFIGCSKENVSENGMPVTGEKVVRSFVAEFATSRTALNDAMTRMVWSEGDQLGIYTDVETDLNVASSTYTKDAGNFSAQIDAAATKVYAYYPYYDKQKDDDKNDRTHKNVSLYIQDAQTQSVAGVLNGNMVGMYASAAIAGEGQNTVLTFDPIASIIAFNIYDLENSGEAVKSVTFSPAGGEKLNGQHIYDLETGTTSSTGTKTSATVTLTTPYVVPAEKPADKSGYIYLAVSPKNYSGGTFMVVTDKNTYTFETTKALDLTNVYAPLTIPMNLAVGTPAADYSGTYVILAKPSVFYALSSTNLNSSSRLDAVEFEYDGTSQPIVVGDQNLVWNITKNENSNTYTCENGGKYLTWYGNDNYAKVDATPYDLLIRPVEEGRFYIVSAEATEKERILAKNTTNPYFAFYTGSGTKDLYLIPAEYKVLPIITLETESAILDFDDEEVHVITADVTNATTVEANAYDDATGTTECSWLVASYENGKVSYTAMTNDTGVARTAYVIVSATNENGNVKATIKIEQKTAGETLAYMFDASKKISSVSSYELYSNVVPNNGMTWTVTFGHTTYVGTNSTNKSKCKLGADYEKVGTPMGYTADQTQIVGIITENPMANIGKVVVSGDTDKYNPENISLVYSVDNVTYTLVETQPYDQSAGNTWTFTPVPNAYYAIVMQYGGGRYMRTNNLKVEYYTVQQ